MNFKRYDGGTWVHEGGRRLHLHPPSYLMESPIMALAVLPGKKTLIAVGHAQTDRGSPMTEYPIRARRGR